MPDETIAPNPTGSASWVVSQTDLASELAERGEAFPEVFATSRMIALMELAASRAIRNQLGPGELSVGVKVNVEHTAATTFGATVRAQARFVGKEGKLYAFQVVASDEAGEIGHGTHHRAVVQTVETHRQRPKTAVIRYPLTGSPHREPFRHAIPH